MSAAPPGSSPPAPSETAPVTWLNKRERGAMLGIRLVFGMATLFGRTPARLFIGVVAFYYRLFDRRAVRASRDWLQRVHGRRPTWGMVYRHILRFAQVSLDRIFLLQRKTKRLVFTRTGHEHLQRLVDAKQGAVLLGAHLGSYEAMRAGGDQTQVPINILGYFQNARMINALVERLNPDAAARVIHIGEDPVGVMLKVRDRIAQGELVAVLGDRVGLNDKSVTVPFFGAEARFAAGPFLLASLLKCPVLLVFGLHFAPNRYELYCEPFVDRVVLPRARRQEALEELVAAYARRLEDYARRAPDNWFNFYDFWRAA